MNLGIILPSVTVLLALIGAVLAQFKAGSKKIFVGLAVANAIVGSAAVWNASKSDSEHAETLKKLATSQAALIAKADSQLEVGNQLAKNLKEAQGTTEKVSQDLTVTSKVVGSVLQQTERALEPLEDLYFTAAFALTESDQESAAVAQALRQGRGPITGSADIDERRRTVLTPPVIMGSVSLGPNSNLIPNPTSALAALVRSARLMMQFYVRPRPISSFPQSSAPDLVTQITVDDRIGGGLELAWPEDRLAISLSGKTTHGAWTGTGKILSVRDITASQVVLQPVFDRTGISGPEEKRLAEEKWKSITILRFVMYTGDGRRWQLDTAKLHAVRFEGVPIFVGHLRGPVSPMIIVP